MLNRKYIAMLCEKEWKQLNIWLWENRATHRQNHVVPFLLLKQSVVENNGTTNRITLNACPSCVRCGILHVQRPPDVCFSCICLSCQCRVQYTSFMSCTTLHYASCTSGSMSTSSLRPHMKVKRDYSSVTGWYSPAATFCGRCRELIAVKLHERVLKNCVVFFSKH